MGDRDREDEDKRNVWIITGESGTYQDVSFTLQPMEQKRVSLLFGDPNRYQDIEMFLSKDTDFWMEQTLQYFRSLTGELKMEEDAMLWEEIEAVDNYIYILNVRFAGDIVYIREIDEDIENIRIPSRIRQPLV